MIVEAQIRELQLQVSLLWGENKRLRERIDGLENIVTNHDRYLTESGVAASVEAQC